MTVHDEWPYFCQLNYHLTTKFLLISYVWIFMFTQYRVSSFHSFICIQDIKILTPKIAKYVTMRIDCLGRSFIIAHTHIQKTIRETPTHPKNPKHHPLLGRRWYMFETLVSVTGSLPPPSLPLRHDICNNMTLPYDRLTEVIWQVTALRLVLRR